MSKTLRYRLFKSGAMPETVRAEIKNEQLVFFDEGIPVTVRRKGSAPGYRGGATGKFSGAVAITNLRVVGTISNTKMVDAQFEMNPADHKPAELSIEADGLHVGIDAGVNPRCSGKIEMHFKAELSSEQLSQFRQRELRFSFPPELVPKLFGVPG